MISCAVAWSIAFVLGAGLSALHIRFRSSLVPMIPAAGGFAICAAILPHPWRTGGTAVFYLVGLLSTIPLWRRVWYRHAARQKLSR